MELTIGFIEVVPSQSSYVLVAKLLEKKVFIPYHVILVYMVKKSQLRVLAEAIFLRTK